MIRLLRKALRGLLRALPVVVVFGCLPPRDANVAECRALVLTEWNAKAERLCPSRGDAAVYWDDCPHAAELDAELGDMLEGCIQ